MTYRLRACGARQIEKWLNRLEVTRRFQAKGWYGVAILDVLESVVVEVDIVLDKLACNIFPVDTGVLRTRLSLVQSLASDGPTSLSYPDRLALSSVDGGMVSIKEEGARASNAVLHSGLEVRVGVHANEVNCLNDRVVGSINVDSPSVYMANRLALKTGSGNGTADLLDVLDEFTGLSTRTGLVFNASGCDTVEILAADRNTNNQVSEGRSVLLDGSLQGNDLIVHICLTSRCPKSKEKGGLGVNGSLDSLDDSVLGAVLDHGVQTSRSPSIGAREGLGSIEFVLKVDELFGLVVIEEGAVVETLEGSIGGGKKASSGQDSR